MDKLSIPPRTLDPAERLERGMDDNGVSVEQGRLDISTLDNEP
jgi:hypothetical protein